jgi:hypothetical protein
MPKLNPFSTNGTIQVRPRRDLAPRDVATFYQRADALCRSAFECCRQHERLSKLVRDGAIGAEQRASEALIAVAGDSLADMAAAYEAVATRVCAESDGACWQAANALWMASREYARRQRMSSRSARDLGDGKHSTQRFAELTVDYDLEASALLFLRQAAESYRRVRPQVAAA